MNSSGKDSPKEEQFMAVLKAVRSELATLKESVERNQSNEERPTSAPPLNQNQQSYQGPRGCPSCQKERKGELCDHCHVCGSGDHWARGIVRERNQVRETDGGYNRGTGSSPTHDHLQ